MLVDNNTAMFMRVFKGML